MYWNNPRSEFYGAKLDRLGPIRLRLTVAVLSVVDCVMETDHGRDHLQSPAGRFRIL